MRRHVHARLATVALVLALAGAACQDAESLRSESAIAEGEAAGETPTTSASGPAADGESAGDDEDATDVSTPLQAFLTEAYAVDGSAEHDDAVYLARMREQEELVATCMADEGFEYVPVPYRDVQGQVASGAWSLEPGEFAEQYGFGITTIDRGDLPSGRIEDPNRPIVAAMSEAERQAYREALYGPGFEELEGERIVAPAPEPDDDVAMSGCLHQAAAEVWDDGEQQGQVDHAEFEELFEEMQLLWTRIETDPRVVAAIDDWSDCMADAGFPAFATPEEAGQAVIDRVEAAVAAAGGSSADDEIGDAGDQALSMVDRSGGGGDRDLSGLDPAVLTELREFEIEVAVADHTCGRDLQAVKLAVQIDIEERFLQDHRTDLERYRDALGVTGAAG